MNETVCTQFEDLGRGATRSAEAARLWRRHRDTCPECRAQERLDAALREALRGLHPPAVREAFADRVVARITAAPARRGAAAARPLLIVYGGLAAAASAFILSALPSPLFDQESVRAIALGGALLSPLVLIGGLRRAVTRLLGAC